MASNWSFVSKYPEEPRVPAWELLSDRELKLFLQTLIIQKKINLILIDGRSGNGKSFIAGKIKNLLHYPVLSTDDIAWNNHPINWDTELKDKIIKPWLKGSNINYRPSGWLSANRKGEIKINWAEVLIIEGVGAGRLSLNSEKTLLIWVQADTAKIYQRGISRDILKEKRSKSEAEAFWANWKSYEDPFLAKEKPWERADLIICGDTFEDKPNTTRTFSGPLLAK
jgi:uridine kinase